MALFVKKQWKIRGQGYQSPSTASAGDSGLIVSTDPPGNVVPERSASSKITGQIRHILEAASSLDRPILSEVVLADSTSLDDSASSAISRITDISDTHYVASARSARTNAEASFHSGEFSLWPPTSPENHQPLIIFPLAAMIRSIFWVWTIDA